MAAGGRPGEHPRPRSGHLIEVAALADKGMETLDPEVAIRIRRTLDDLSSAYPAVGHVRVSVDDYGDCGWMAIAARGLVIINRPYWTPDYLAANEREWDGMVVDSTPEGIIRHEFGHVAFRAAEDLLGAEEANERAMAGAGTDRWDCIGDGVVAASPFGQENVSEWLAEGFSAYDLGRASMGVFSDAALAAAREFWTPLMEDMRAQRTARDSVPAMR